jgi:hypothetical protein
MPPMSKMVKIVEENPWTSDALIPKTGISKILNIRTNRRAMNDAVDIKIPI